MRFADVDAEHARLEGEGDGSLAAWAAAHEPRLREVAARTGRAFGPDVEVVLERFEVRFGDAPGRRHRADRRADRYLRRSSRSGGIAR